MLEPASDSVSTSLPTEPPAAAPPPASCFSSVLGLAFSNVTRGSVDNQVLGLQKAGWGGEQHGCTCSAGALPSAGEQMLSGVPGGLCSHHGEPASVPSLLDSTVSGEAAPLPLPLQSQGWRSINELCSFKKSSASETVCKAGLRSCHPRRLG